MEPNNSPCAQQKLYSHFRRRFDPVAFQFLLQLFNSHLADIKVVFDLPKVSVTYRISTSVVSQDILSLVDRSSKCETFAHGETDECAATSTVGLRQVLSNVPEVEMFEE